MSDTAARRLLKELRQISRSSVFDRQADFELKDENARSWIVKLQPDGLYKGAVFEFELTFPEDYPASPPAVQCQTEIYHPNIAAPNVCFNMFQKGGDGWSPNLTAENYINGLLWLLRNPNHDSALNGNVSRIGFTRKARLSLTGTSIGGRAYPKFIDPEGVCKEYPVNLVPRPKLSDGVESMAQYFQALIDTAEVRGIAPGRHFGIPTNADLETPAS